MLSNTYDDDDDDDEDNDDNIEDYAEILARVCRCFSRSYDQNHWREVRPRFSQRTPLLEYIGPRISAPHHSIRMSVHRFAVRYKNEEKTEGGGGGGGGGEREAEEEVEEVEEEEEEEEEEEGKWARVLRRGGQEKDEEEKRAALPDSAPCHPPFVSSAVPVGVHRDENMLPRLRSPHTEYTRILITFEIPFVAGQRAAYTTVFRRY
ncbi:hypothetical protein HZH66_001399 [Vespula vulgaris]|uniref:Uncharacterized protein n=1 Tax=Vespula vulgaris TaxID=7454 RepID=A0A834NLP7_VESVU|nr:hypothetical protein HZH66_001399 [Vespula vulgaris]